MKQKQLRLVKKSNKRKRNSILVLLCVIFILALGVFFCFKEFSIENIEVKGVTTYSQNEVIHAIQTQDYVPNTLVMIGQNRVFGQTYLPFVESIHMTYEHPHVLKVKVKEKLRAGVFEYMGKNVYFNSEGIAMESRNHLFDGVPVVTGVKFDKMTLGEQIPAQKDYFDIIVSITKKISTYNLDISEIKFDGLDSITLISGKYKILLGSSEYLDGKMSKISNVIEATKKKHKKGIIDMHLYTDDKNLITYKKESK